MTTLTTNDAFMMVNLDSRSTGLPCNIWLGQRGLAHEAPHISHLRATDHRSQFDLDSLAVVGIDPVEVIGKPYPGALLRLVGDEIGRRASNVCST